MTLQQFFKENPSAALGFSGGADSSYLLYAALNCGADVKAYYVKTQFQPEFQLRDAFAVASQLGTELSVIELNLLGNERLAANPADRCYHCMRAMFEGVRKKAVEDGYMTLMDGSNAGDDAGEYPGMRALRELVVRSPLRECGITGDDVRRLSKEAGLSTWNKPESACLAARMPAGCRFSAELLRRVESAEDAVAALGFTDFCLCVYKDAARLQFREGCMMRTAVDRRSDIAGAVAPYFSEVLLDLRGWQV